jgi:Domain of unknown function (DUF4115)
MRTRPALPRSGEDRILAALTVVAAAAFVGLAVAQPAPKEAAQSRARPTSASEPAVPRRRPVSSAASRPEARATPTNTTSAKPAREIRVVAARGDCWLEIRRGASDGESLYYGLLEHGRSIVLPGTSVWVRAGAGENIDLTVGGRALEPPSGLTQFRATSQGLTPE